MTWKEFVNKIEYRRILNKSIRHINKDFSSNELWQGRFFIRKGESFMGFGQDSGNEPYIQLWFYDRKTGQMMCDCTSMRDWCLLDGRKIWESMNRFITSVCLVWENEDPYNEKHNWNKDKGCFPFF